MKMLTLTLILSLITLPVLAPGFTTLYILRADPINFYDPLIKAVVTVESNGNNSAYNAFEGAVGAFQIRPCRIEHYNRLTGLNYALSDMYDYEKAKQVFLYFCKGRSYEAIARGWAGGDNGTKKATEKYWKRVKSKL
jgi:hypothetical protein